MAAEDGLSADATRLVNDWAVPLDAAALIACQLAKSGSP
jgi:hypothetical protein